MALTGNLLLAFLEEDNVQRSLFRVRPLITESGVVPQHELDALGDEGYLRIVPDRKEQHTFKERMREIGPLCVLVRQPHVEKIRPNKNYAPLRGEKNRMVIYSDAVLALPEDVFFEVVADLRVPPMTPQYCLRSGGRIQGPYSRKTGQEAGRQSMIAPDSERLFAVQLPDGHEKLFYWPLPPAQETPPVEKAGTATMPAAPWMKQETIRLMPPPGGAEPSVLPDRQTVPPPDAPPERPIENRVLNPLHEVVDRQRRYRYVRDRDRAVPAPDILHQYTQVLETLWQAEHRRVAAVEALAAMPGATELLGTRLPGLKEHAVTAAMRRQLEDMEAERLKLIMETDRARNDRDAFAKEAIAAAERKQKAALDALLAETARAQAALDVLRAEQQNADGQPAAEGTTAPPLRCSFEEAAARADKCLKDAGVDMAPDETASLLLHTLLSNQVQLAAPTLSDALTAAEAFSAAIGMGCTVMPRDEALPPSAAPACAFVITLQGSIAPAQYTRLIAADSLAPGRENAFAYALNPWPVVRVRPGAGWPGNNTALLEPIDFTDLRKQVLAGAADLSPEMLDILNEAQQAFTRRDKALPLKLRQAAATYLRCAASLMPGGAAAALDHVFASLIMPYALYTGVGTAPFRPLLAAMPHAASLAQ